MPKYRDKGEVSVYGHAKANPSGYNSEDYTVGVEKEYKETCEEEEEGNV